ncbi:MAG: formylglycine-generating enzyme family protein [Thermoguttaceae bacterium]|nr:formylglycine-generating enzyme family protein [Thermoguttaceae bacterium]
MKRSERARRVGRSALVAAAVCGVGANFADFNVGAVCANDGEAAVAVKSATSARMAVSVNDGDLAAFPLATPGEKAGERRTFTVDGVEFAFRWAPPGRFLQGSPESEEGRDWYEYRREVELTRGFWILETETTQAMWNVVFDENPSKFRGPKRPVDSVGLAEIAEFCAALSERVGANGAVKPVKSGKSTKNEEAEEATGVLFALPTEAQWEYAARAGTTGPYPAATLEEIAWFGDENDGGTRDVATKKPNAWGLYDVCGNLWEWCADRYGDYPTDENGRGLSAIDPTGATPEECPGNVRVDRGGCWDSEARECRTAYRGYYDADRKGPYVGFRFVCVPKTEKRGDK